MPNDPSVVVIGAGIAGLVAALDLATRGVDVLVLEAASAPGGKMRRTAIGSALIDAGPTVLTMKWVFDEIFAAAGADLEAYVTMTPADVIARHAWDCMGTLDLYADLERSVDAIARFSGAEEARRYRNFCRQAQRTYDVLDKPFISNSVPTLTRLLARVGIAGLPGLSQIKPYNSLWSELGRYFHDGRLRQLFGRYSTYCGSSPLQAPATLMLIAHVERLGVWLVDGGMHQLALALEKLARSRGVTIQYDARVAQVEVERGRASGVTLATGERIGARAVVANCDVGAFGAQHLGPDVDRAVPSIRTRDRSLSAVTWACVARTSGFPLSRHNVFFGPDSVAEFDQIFAQGRLPAAPTVYVCAQDRDGNSGAWNGTQERLLVIVNAPAIGDRHSFQSSEIEECEHQVFSHLKRCGLRVESSAECREVTTPNDFEQMFPGTGGAIYGRASHGWLASFQRQGARSRIKGLYLTGGSTHPGAGVPMAALSGRIAAATLIADSASIGLSRRAVTSGGMLMP